MADFNKAYQKTKRYEGGYADVPGDSGGVTYAGISHVHQPDWEGWPVVLSKPRKHNEHIPELDAAVKEFYRVNYWLPVRGDEIMDQEFADHTFDMAVNAGIKTAIKLAQKAVGALEDGVLGPITLNLINGLA